MNARKLVKNLFDDELLESVRKVACAKIVFTATSEWLQIAERQGLAIDWDAEPISSDTWDEACDLCEFDSDDEEVGFSVLDEPRPQDTALKPGDIVGTCGPGGDVVFFRCGS